MQSSRRHVRSRQRCLPNATHSTGTSTPAGSTGTESTTARLAVGEPAQPASQPVSPGRPAAKQSTCLPSPPPCGPGGCSPPPPRPCRTCLQAGGQPGRQAETKHGRCDVLQVSHQPKQPAQLSLAHTAAGRATHWPAPGSPRPPPNPAKLSPARSTAVPRTLRRQQAAPLTGQLLDLPHQALVGLGVVLKVAQRQALGPGVLLRQAGRQRQAGSDGGGGGGSGRRRGSDRLPARLAGRQAAETLKTPPSHPPSQPPTQPASQPSQPAHLQVAQHALLQGRLAVVDGDGVVVAVQPVDQRLRRQRQAGGKRAGQAGEGRDGGGRRRWDGGAGRAGFGQAERLRRRLTLRAPAAADVRQQAAPPLQMAAARRGGHAPTPCTPPLPATHPPTHLDGGLIEVAHV